MANLHKGETAFKIGDGDSQKEYTIRFSADAICNLEDKLGKSTSEILELLQDGKKLRMTMVREMFVIGLRDRHADIDEPAARVLFKELLPPEAMGLVVQAFTRSYGGDEAAEEQVSQSPPAPGGPSDGTGPAFSRHGSASASMPNDSGAVPLAKSA